MVGELVIQPKDQGTYIPFVHHTLVRRLCHLKTLVYDFDYQSAWVYPPRHHLLVLRYPITELDIRNPPITTWSQMFRLIRALPHLQRLSLAMWGPQYDTDSGTSNVNAILRPLRTLVIEGRQSYDCLPERAFGTSVKNLALECGVPSGHQYGPLSGQIHCFSSLQELFIGIRLPDRLKKDDFAATAYIVPILTQLPSQDTLRSIIVRITQIQGITRLRFLRELSWNDVGELLVRKFPKLQTLRFRLPERSATSGGRFDSERWTGMLYDHMPKLRGVVPISVTIDRLNYSSYWARDLVLEGEDTESNMQPTVHIYQAATSAIESRLSHTPGLSNIALRFSPHRPLSHDTTVSCNCRGNPSSPHPPSPARTKCRIPDIVRDYSGPDSHSGSRFPPNPHLDLLSTSTLFPTSTISELPFHVSAIAARALSCSCGTFRQRARVK